MSDSQTLPETPNKFQPQNQEPEHIPVLQSRYKGLARNHCLPLHRWEGRWEGSHVNITVWVAEEANTNDSLLTLTIRAVGSSSENHYDTFHLSRERVDVVRVRNHTKQSQSMSLSEPMGNGWIEIRLWRSDSQVEIQRPSTTNSTLTLHTDTHLQKLTITASNITVNCHGGVLGWEVCGGEETVVPLPTHDYHRLALLLTTASRPSVSLGDTTLQMVWDGSSLMHMTPYQHQYKSPVLAPTQYQSPASTPTQYQSPASTPTQYQSPVHTVARRSVTLCFHHLAGSVVCTLLVEQEDITSVTLRTLPTFLKASGEPTDNYYILYHSEPNHSCQAHSPPGDNDEYEGVKAGQVAAIVIITLAFAGILFIMVISSIPHTRKQKKPRLSFLEKVQQECEPFLQAEDPPPRHTHSVIMERALWESVMEGQTEVVEELLEEENLHPDDVELGRNTSPHMDVHILGNMELHHIFTKHKGEERCLPSDELIKCISYEFEKQVKGVFLAGECGMYEHEGGVAALLNKHKLPGTVTDHKGRSLVHCMASVTALDGTPPWQPQDIKRFFNTHDTYVNAVDHWGRTALHELSQHPRHVEVDVIWDGKEWRVEEAWLTLAKILTSHGCDPRIPDHQGRLSHHLAHQAHNYLLEHYLRQKCEELGEKELGEKEGERERMVRAATEGDTALMRELLIGGAVILPSTARVDPLIQAIRHSQRDAVLLLLCAGAPLCNTTTEGVTALEVAHNTLGLPAIFPALMRKACCERLEDEMTRVDKETASLMTLRQAMSDYSLQVMDVGSRAKWIYSGTDPEQRVTEARTLLTQAAELGLSLTCQLLGLEDVHLHSLPGEDNPYQRAITHAHTYTQLVLYRDLRLSPFTCDTTHLEALPFKQLENHWINESKVAEDFCSHESEEAKISILRTLQELKGLNNKTNEQRDQQVTRKPSSRLLYLVAKHGLVTLLHALLGRWPVVDINQVVEEYSGCTMLHVAAMFGQMNIVEYVMHHGGNSQLMTVGNFTPAHMAALAGHTKCLRYMLAFLRLSGSTVHNKCIVGLTAEQLMTKYDNLCRNCKLPLLTHEEALCVKNERGEEAQTSNILLKKSKIMNISLSEDLLVTAANTLCDKSNMKEFLSRVKEQLDNLYNQINDPRFQGKLIAVGSVAEGREIFSVTEVNFVYEVSGCEATPVTCTRLTMDGRTTVVIEPRSENELFQGDTFKHTFVHLVKTLVKDYVTTLPNVSLAPPFVTATENGACLYWLWNSANKIKLLKTCVVPVLPAAWPSDKVINLHSGMNQFENEDDNLVFHVTNVHKEWMCRSYLYEHKVFSNLSTNQAKVWATCRFVNQLVEGCWWSPRFTNRCHPHPWHTLSLRVPSLPEPALKALFLRELTESDEWDTERHMFERVTSVFRRAAQRDMRGKFVAREQITSFLPPGHYCLDGRDSICGILEFLQHLKDAQTRYDKIPKVKFV
ncbi:uncharacterized protein LOC121870486 [Homarus americanus]|uniref:uncharacterized protein LOC121870486 n=1 Tax=Homarus americanus TaxID=6706 RepID=UPI001C44A814|nr:uncharacterized protein LOC121870486 [Homarus americanus]